ncbi:MAG TPA: alpha-hydroxy-acid oxidizing protein, partial [Paenirhodobacter sp.]
MELVNHVDCAGEEPLLDRLVTRPHVLKSVAFGADFVFVGRPFIYAAAIAGEAGVMHAFKIMSDEIERNMGLLGITSL